MADKTTPPVPRWGDEDPDEEMSDASEESVDIFTGPPVIRTTPSRAPRFPPDPTTPTPRSKKGKKRAAAQAQLSPHQARAGPSMVTTAGSTRILTPETVTIARTLALAQQPTFSPQNPLSTPSSAPEPIPAPDANRSTQLV